MKRDTLGTVAVFLLLLANFFVLSAYLGWFCVEFRTASDAATYGQTLTRLSREAHERAIEHVKHLDAERRHNAKPSP